MDDRRAPERNFLDKLSTACVAAEGPIAQIRNIALSSSRDIPFNKLLLSRANVRRITAGVAIEELAEDIGRHTLLQSLTVRSVLGESGAETGMYEVAAGGRRFHAPAGLDQARCPAIASSGDKGPRGRRWR